MYAVREGISLKDTEMYITLSPCITCAKLIAAAGIRAVIYEKQYRDTAGVEFLNKNRIPCRAL